MNMNNQNNNSNQNNNRERKNTFLREGISLWVPANDECQQYLCRIRCSNGDNKFLGSTKPGEYNFIIFEKSDYKQFYIC